MEEYSSDFVNNLYIEYSPGVAKIKIDNRVLSLNLSDLCNKISLCNIIDNSAAKNSIKKGRLYNEKENEFVMFMLWPVNKIQPSQSNWNFPDFPPVPLPKPELLKLTIVMKIEMYYLTRRQSCQFPPWSKKSNIFPRISRVVTFLAWRYNSRETVWFQTTELKNPWKS